MFVMIFFVLLTMTLVLRAIDGTGHLVRLDSCHGDSRRVLVFICAVPGASNGSA
jgi:hypothetical protein